MDREEVVFGLNVFEIRFGIYESLRPNLQIAKARSVVIPKYLHQSLHPLGSAACFADMRLTNFMLGMVLALGASWPALGQLVRVPIGQPMQPGAQQADTEDACLRTLSLPFFDDFSQGRSANWQRAEGVLFNNTFSDGHPTLGMATFDGLNVLGQPYSADNASGFGAADSLISHCIGLGDFVPADSVVVRFFYQAMGLGERPNLEDSLVLLGRNSAGQWRRLWSAIGDTVTPGFREVDFTLTDTAFFHDGFRLAFFNYAKVIGAFDHWHVDYVHVFAQNNDDPELRYDVALVQQPSSALAGYSALPFTHFRENPDAYLADSVRTRIFNLSESFKVIGYTAKVRQYEYINGIPLLFNEAPLSTFAYGPNGGGAPDANIINAGSTLELRAMGLEGFLDLSFDSMMVETEFVLDTEEQNLLIPTRNNDSIRHRTLLTNFAAYDDGSAEYGLGVRQKFGQIAYEYHTPIRAPLTHIDIYLPPFGVLQNGGIYRLMVWQTINKSGIGQDEVLLRQTRPVVFADSVNRFERISLFPGATGLDDFIYVEDTFYIGIQQVSDEMLAIGFDRNYDSGERIYANIGSGWEANPGFEGSLMIRPVFERLRVTGFDADPQTPEVSLYPNPAHGWVRIRAEGLAEVSIADLSGRTIWEKPTLANQEEVSLSGWQPGVYLVRMRIGQQWFVHQLIVNSER